MPGQGAEDALLEGHAAAVMRYARAVCGDEEAADAVVRRTFVDALREGGDRGRAALLALARRHAGRGAERAEEELMALGVAAGWGADAEVAPAEQLAAAFAALDAADRELLVLRDLEGLAIDDAAAVLGAGVAATKSALHRARLRLVAALRTGGAERDAADMVAEPRDKGGLSCDGVVARLGEQVDGELAADELARVEAHLARCATCARFAARYARTVDETRRRLAAPPALDLFQLERIRSRSQG